MVDASSMAQAIKPPETTLPRLRWVPLVGKWLSQLLPPRRHVGRVLSWQEYYPFQQIFGDAQVIICDGCEETLLDVSKENHPPEWKGCTCDGAPAPRSKVEPQKFLKVTKAFLRAQGIPWRPVLNLPGKVMFEVMADFFALQTRANLAPTGPLTDGTNSQPRGEGRQQERQRGEPQTPS